MMTAGQISGFTGDRARTKFLALYQSTFERLWTVEHRRLDVSTSYGTTRVYRSGRTDGIPVVLLPGAGGNALMWHRYVGRLGEDRPVIAIDPVGEPGCSTQDKAIADADDLTTWLDETLSALDVDRAHLVGCSYGGWVALRYAMRSPGWVVTVTLLDPVGFGRINLRFMLWVIAGGLAAFAPAPLRRRAARWLHNATLLDDDAMRLVAALWTFRRRLPLPVSLTDDELRGITVPVLALFGERSVMYSATEVAERVEALMPAGRAEIVPGASHDLPVYCPDLAADRAAELANRADQAVSADEE